MTEAEEAALNEADSKSTSNPSATETSPPRTTTAPPGAPLEEVQAGMHHDHDDDDAQEDKSAPYAEGGSLAKELAREREETAAAKEKAGEGEK